jgi:hypothetical protein
MDIGQRIKKKARDFYLHQVGSRRASDSGHYSRQDSRDIESGSRPDLEKPGINDELREVTSTVKGLDERVLANVLALLSEAAQVHAKDPMAGHRLADRVLLQVINNDKVSAAYDKCC